MGWFTRMCRNTGLMIHHATKPVKGQKQVVSRKTQEHQLNDTVTLRRTTIEEVEVKPNGSDNHNV